MLALTLESCATLRALAEHIDARGEHVRYNLYSVDVRAEQQYLTSKRLTIGSPVCLENNHLSLLERDVQRRDWRCCRLEVVLEQMVKEKRVSPANTCSRYTMRYVWAVTGPQVAFFCSNPHPSDNWNSGFERTIPILCCRCVAIPKGFHICCATLKPNIQRSVLDETRLL